MKAKGAPKKLYIDLFNGEFNVSYSPANNSIEYVHTDAFIEKALSYLNSKFYFHNAFYVVLSTDFNAMEELFDDLKKIYERRVIW